MSNVSSSRVAINVAVPLTLAVFGLSAHLLTPRGAVAGAMVGLAVIDAGYDVAAALAVFFLLGSLVTKVGASHKTGLTPGDVRPLTGSCVSSGGDGTVGVTVGGMGAKAKQSKRGRDEWQVAATAGIPALLCLSRHMGVPAAVWRPATLAYFACSAGDTFASELGMLAREAPRNILTLRPSRRGQDGAVTFAGTAASMLGGALVGACGAVGDTGSLAALLWCAARGALWGGIGSSLDSVGGALLQPDIEASHRAPGTWKGLNNLVNVLSSAATAVLAVAVAAQPALEQPLWLALGVCLLALAPITVFIARKLLHVFTSVLVLQCAQQRALITGVAVVTLVLLFTLRGLLARFEGHGVNSPGIAVYTVATGVAAAVGLNPFYALGPMMFADPAAALCGSAVASPRLFGTKKTVVGTFMCFFTTFAWYTWLASANGAAVAATALGTLDGGDGGWVWLGGPLSLGAAAVLGAVLAVVECVSGVWDNATLPIATVAGVWLLQGAVTAR